APEPPDPGGEADRDVVRAEQAEQRLVELGADRDGAGLGEVGHRRSRVELRVLGDLEVVRTVSGLLLWRLAATAPRAARRAASGEREQRDRGDRDPHAVVLVHLFPLSMRFSLVS